MKLVKTNCVVKVQEVTLTFKGENETEVYIDVKMGDKPKIINLYTFDNVGLSMEQKLKIRDDVYSFLSDKSIKIPNGINLNPITGELKWNHL